MSAIAIIPVRGGSRRIPGKNIRLFHGKPIIQYSVEAARESKLFDEVFVSTDHEGIGVVVSDMDVKVLMRPEALGHNSVGTQEVVRHALSTMWRYEGHDPAIDHVCCIYATAPLMTVDDLMTGFSMLRGIVSPYVYTVGPDHQDAGQWYWGTYAAFINGVELDYGQQYRLPADRTCDINVEADWLRAEQLYKDLYGPH